MPMLARMYISCVHECVCLIVLQNLALPLGTESLNDFPLCVQGKPINQNLTPDMNSLDAEFVQ